MCHMVFLLKSPDDFFSNVAQIPFSKMCWRNSPSMYQPTPQMDKSKKEEAKLEAEETFWEGPPSSTEAHIGNWRWNHRHGPPSEWEEWCNNWWAMYDNWWEMMRNIWWIDNDLLKLELRWLHYVQFLVSLGEYQHQSTGLWSQVKSFFLNIWMRFSMRPVSLKCVWVYFLAACCLRAAAPTADPGNNGAWLMLVNQLMHATIHWPTCGLYLRRSKYVFYEQFLRNLSI